MKRLALLLMMGLLCCGVRSANALWGDNTIIVNGTDKIALVMIKNQSPGPDELGSLLLPGEVVQYSNRPIVAISISMYTNYYNGALVTFDNIGPGDSGLYVIKNIAAAPGFKVELEGPYQRRGVGKGTVYIVNTTPYALRYHVGYITAFCSSDNGELKAGGVAGLQLGFCNTDNIQIAVHQPNGLPDQITNIYRGHINNGVLVVKEVFLGSRLFELKGPWDFA